MDIWCLFYLFWFPKSSNILGSYKKLTDPRKCWHCYSSLETLSYFVYIGEALFYLLEVSWKSMFHVNPKWVLMFPADVVCFFTWYLNSVLLVFWTCTCSLETIYLVSESLKLWTDGSSQLIDTCTRTELSYVWCMIIEKEKF